MRLYKACRVQVTKNTVVQRVHASSLQCDFLSPLLCVAVVLTHRGSNSGAQAFLYPISAACGLEKASFCNHLHVCAILECGMCFMNLWGVGVNVLFGYVLHESGLMSLLSRVEPQKAASPLPAMGRRYPRCAASLLPPTWGGGIFTALPYTIPYHTITIVHAILRTLVCSLHIIVLLYYHSIVLIVLCLYICYGYSYFVVH